MSFLNELINSVADEDLREELHDRVDIVVHKIKFMDKVPVACLSIENQTHTPIDYLLELAGGEPVNDPMQAKVIIYFEYQTGIGELMSKVVPLLSTEWPAVAYKHVYLMDDTKVLAKEPQDLVARLEDIAEMLHPGFFVFGNEGERWINFGA
ncbi:MAG: hypothetical protein EOO07_11465 [Chitinophagaceae bacterium]|nr:MAG: hypothetical protein EOO07_11465 [Chitinophagaceae bacterium]